MLVLIECIVCNTALKLYPECIIFIVTYSEIVFIY